MKEGSKTARRVRGARRSSSKSKRVNSGAMDDTGRSVGNAGVFEDGGESGDDKERPECLSRVLKYYELYRPIVNARFN